MTSVADAWGRRKRRLSWAVALGTLLSTTGAAWFFTLPTWTKWIARGWPTVPARVEDVKQHFNDGRAWLFEGSKLTVTFSYVAPDGARHEAIQDVSSGFASERLRLNDNAYFTAFDGTPWLTTCHVDPADPHRAVLQTSLAHADVPALLPLVVLFFGALMFVAERRNAARAGDLGVRAASRNGQRWRIATSDGTLAASSTADLTPDAMLFTALVNWPALAVRVAPHPVTLGAPITVDVSFASRRRWRRRLRVRLMLGPFGGNARWSADVFDGSLAPDESVRQTIALPRAGDLPPGVDDCWLRITARTLPGMPWSRTLWIALDAGR